ncbi:MAG: PAS domain S-box protein [Methylococcales bacterium]
MRKVAEVYAQLKLSKPLSERRLAQFINPFNRSDDKPLIVGSEQDFPPLALGKTDATADGFTVELWRAVAAETHLNSTIRVLPFHDVLEEFRAEKIDVLINLALSNERRKFADFSVPHVVLNGAIFVRDDENTIHSEADIKNKQLIVVKDDLAPEYLQEKGWDKQIVEVDTVEAGLKLLADGHYDAMLVSKLVGKKTLEKLNIRTIKMLAIDLDLTQKFSFAVHKGDAELLAKINEGLAIIKANGTYDKLYEKWFGVYEEKQLLPLVIKYLTRIVIVFLLILLLIFYRHHIERKQATKQLSQRERHLRAILDLSPDCIKLVARDGTLLSINPTGLAIIEAGSEDEVRNNSIYPIIAPEYRAAFQAFNEDICDGKSGNMEFEVFDLKGVKHWMATHAVPLRLENGDSVQLAFSQEITERKRIEERLRILSVAVEQSPTSIMISDLKGDLLYVNPKFTEVTGYSAEEIIGQNPRLLQSGLTPTKVYKQLWDSLTHGKVWQGELINRHKDGRCYWEDVHIAPVKDLSGVTTHYVGVKLDITARKQNEEALQRSEEKFRTLFDSTGNAVMLLDERGYFDCNQAALTLFGCKTVAEFCTYHPVDLSPATQPCGTDSLLLANQRVATAMEKGSLYFEWQHKRVDTGECFPAEVLLSAMTLDEKPMLQATVRDITDRKRAEKYNQFRNTTLELLAGNEPLSRIFEAIVLGVEQLNPKTLCSILLLDNEGKHLLNGAAPSLPDFYNNAVNGIEIGMGMGSCGTAAFINERVIVEDIKTHPYWAPYKDLATRASLGACWSQPIRSSTAQVLGTFAIYHHSNHTPSDDDIQLIEQSAHLISIAIEKSLATEKLRASEQRFRHFFERNSSVMMLIEPKSGQIKDANKAAADYYGYTIEQLICMNISDINTLSPLYITEEKRLTLQAIRTHFNFRHRLASGEIRAVEVHSTPIENSGHPLLFSIVHDITERTLAEVQLRIAATVFEAQEGMLITDASNVIIKVNHAFTQITGYSMEEAIGKNPRFLKSGKQDKAFYAALWQSINDKGAWQGELWNRRKNGEIYPEWTTITAVKSSNDNAITHYVATLTDITERKAAEEKIQKLAFYDPLTGLPNRRKLLDRLEYSIALNQRANSQFAVFMMDLDKFKAVNDKLGHAAGDELLKQVARRITGCLRNSDMVARLGGDEFVLVLENLKIPEAAETVALKIIADLTVPFQLSDNNTVQIGASIGISIYPQHGNTSEKLMDHADTALYQAKDNGRGCFSHFSGS